MADFETASIYVDLDSLLDTRMGTLYQFGIKAVEKTVASGYYERRYDEFEGVDTEVFKKAYAERNAATLLNSMVTTVCELVTNFGKQTLLALVSTPLRRQPKVFLNVYPYVLGEDVQLLLIAGLKQATEGLLDIEVGYMAPEELTPDYVKSHFLQVIMYSYWEWLEIHAQNGNFEKTQCPQVTLFGPAIVQSKEAYKALEGQNVFNALEAYSSLFIKLQLLPVKMYCVDLIRLKTKNTPA